MSPLTVTLQVPYAEDEQQFLLQAVKAAVRTFRSLNGKPGDGFAEGSSTGTADRHFLGIKTQEGIKSLNKF